MANEVTIRDVDLKELNRLIHLYHNEACDILEIAEACKNCGCSDVMLGLDEDEDDSEN